MSVTKTTARRNAVYVLRDISRGLLVDRLTADYDEWAHPHLVETRHDGEFTYYEPDVEAIVDRVLDALGLSG